MWKKSFKIDKKFYTDEIITKWIQVFQENFNIIIKNSSVIIDEEENQDMIFDEFMNYLVYLQITA